MECRFSLDGSPTQQKPSKHSLSQPLNVLVLLTYTKQANNVFLLSIKLT